MNFLFDPEKHLYTLGGVQIPSVTQVLPYNYRGNNEDAKQKGSYVHRMIEFKAKGVLDEETLDPQLKPYLEAYKRLLNEYRLTGVMDIKSGSPHPCTELQLAGYRLLADEGIPIHPDLVYPCLEVAFYHPQYRFAGTIDILAEGHQAMAVYLKDNGKYQVQDHTKDLRKNKQIFLSFLTTFIWKKERGLL